MHTTCRIIVPASVAAAVLVVASWLGIREVTASTILPNLLPLPNPHGLAATYSSSGGIDLGNPFFQSLGTNGRTCGTCHQPSDGMSVTPPHIRERFYATAGLDPIFRTNDGSNCDHNINVATFQGRRAAYSQLLTKGLIRIALPVPANAEFTVSAVDNPYGCSDIATVSVYRRPLPSTNLRFLSTVMWDGRESLPGNTLEQNLAHQAMDATTGHAQGAVPPDSQIQQIVDLESALSTAQIWQFAAGRLNAHGAIGGPQALSSQAFFAGINDPLGTGPFDPSAFTLFNAWQNLGSSDDDWESTEARRSIARGEVIFDTKPIAITGVAGLNGGPSDPLGIQTFNGTCTTCHNTPNVGNHSVPLAIDIGLNDASRRTPDMPLFTLVNNQTGETRQTMDPGRALITGKWKDIGKIKGPILRALSARAPYFHNGSAATFLDVVNFYGTRFGVEFTVQEKRDLVNFLSTL